MTSTPDLYERITADEVDPGDSIARTRTAKFETVASLKVSPVAVRFVNENGQTIMRPRRTAKLWRLKYAEYAIYARSTDGTRLAEKGRVTARDYEQARQIAEDRDIIKEGERYELEYLGAVSE